MPAPLQVLRLLQPLVPLQVLLSPQVLPPPLAASPTHLSDARQFRLGPRGAARLAASPAGSPKV